jgi:hypothetical protein
MARDMVIRKSDAVFPICWMPQQPISRLGPAVILRLQKLLEIDHGIRVSINLVAP